MFMTFRLGYDEPFVHFVAVAISGSGALSGLITRSRRSPCMTSFESSLALATNSGLPTWREIHSAAGKVQIDRYEGHPVHLLGLNPTLVSSCSYLAGPSFPFRISCLS